LIFALSAIVSTHIFLLNVVIADLTIFAINQNKIHTIIATHSLGRKSVAIQIRSPANQEFRFTTSFKASFTVFAIGHK